MTLRKALMLWLTAILAVILAGVAATVYWQVNRQTSRSYRESLTRHLNLHWPSGAQEIRAPEGPHPHHDGPPERPHHEKGPGGPPHHHPEPHRDPGGPGGLRRLLSGWGEGPGEKHLDRLRLQWPAEGSPDWDEMASALILVRFYDAQLRCKVEKGGTAAPILPSQSQDILKSMLEEGRRFESYSVSTSFERWSMIAVRVTDPQGQTVGVVELGQGSKPQDDILRTLAAVLLMTGVLGWLVGAVAAGPLVGHLARPLEELAQAAQRVSRGDFQARADEGGTQEMRSLAHDFNQMVDQIGSMFEIQKRFVADASHELKTPLTSLATTTELLQQDQLTPEKQQRAFAILEKEVGRMNHLVQDLLTLSRLETETVEPASVDLRSLVRELVEDYQIRHPRLELELTGCPPTYLAVREQDWLRIVRNLLDNALAHTPEPGKVLVRLQRERRQQAGILLTVKDEGVGIASEDLTQVTRRFFRTDLSRSRNTGGTGLGLSIVAAWAERQGADLTLESELGRGTEVRLWIPIER